MFAVISQLNEREVATWYFTNEGNEDQDFLIQHAGKTATVLRFATKASAIQSINCRSPAKRNSLSCFSTEEELEYVNLLPPAMNRTSWYLTFDDFERLDISQCQAVEDGTTTQSTGDSQLSYRKGAKNGALSHITIKDFDVQDIGQCQAAGNGTIYDVTTELFNLLDINQYRGVKIRAMYHISTEDNHVQHSSQYQTDESGPSSYIATKNLHLSDVSQPQFQAAENETMCDVSANSVEPQEIRQLEALKNGTMCDMTEGSDYQDNAQYQTVRHVTFCHITLKDPGLRDVSEIQEAEN